MKTPNSIACMIVPILLLADITTAQPEPAQREGRRECAVCHLQEVEAFDHPEAILLIDRPEDAIVAEDKACLGCHDGSVGDSRRRVWLEHSHKTGIEPPETMDIPGILPLQEGKIVCRTCHTAHLGSGGETLAMAMSIRVQNDASQLCEMCHPGHTKGPELGTHPVGGMPWPVPQEIIAAGAKIGPDQHRLICQTCHTPHGSHEDHLLVMGTQSSQLCLTCHWKLRPWLWRAEIKREHPQSPSLSSDVQRKAVEDMGTKTGPGGELICLSCHKLHHGLSGRDMLADTLQDSKLCMRCHPERAEMVGTVHDLRTSAPQEINRLGRTPHESGPCGVCHSFHQFARNPEPSASDPTGLCFTCHRENQCAGKATGLPLSHPTTVGEKYMPTDNKLFLFDDKEGGRTKSLACLTCHDPHEASQAHFLNNKPDELCSTCHSTQSLALTGPHDFTRHPQLVNGKGHTAEKIGKCGFCHAVHDAYGPAMWAATKDTPTGPDDMCKQCHRTGGLAAESPVPELRHPIGPETTTAAQKSTCRLPLFNDKCEISDRGYIACASCHDPHAGLSDPEHLLRKGDRPLAGSMCLQCHDQVRNMPISMHSETIISEYARNTGIDIPTVACGPCHVAHVKPGMAADGMWAGPLGPTNYPPDAQKCLGCHGPNGNASPAKPVEHPAVAMQNINPSAAPGFMPLVDETGAAGTEGRISCSTCHLPHGRIPDNKYPAIDPNKITRNELRATRPMIRPYTVPNLCSSCHGFDGLRRFLYYHAPEKRKGQNTKLTAFGEEIP